MGDLTCFWGGLQGGPRAASAFTIDLFWVCCEVWSCRLCQYLCRMSFWIASSWANSPGAPPLLLLNLRIAATQCFLALSALWGDLECDSHLHWKPTCLLGENKVVCFCCSLSLSCGCLSRSRLTSTGAWLRVRFWNPRCEDTSSTTRGLCGWPLLW